MNSALKKIDLMEGLDGIGSGAFDGVAMAEDGVNNMALSRYIANKLAPIAQNVGGYLKEGCGFGVIFDGEHVTIIGLAPQGEE